VAKTFTHEADADRYVLRIDDELIAVVDYKINGDAISFTHTFTNPSKRGKGYAGEVVGFAVDDVEKTSTRHNVPMCWYVGKWFDEHPDRSALLAAR
jgi:predicted GNAT family acetyltransferase